MGFVRALFRGFIFNSMVKEPKKGSKPDDDQKEWRDTSRNPAIDEEIRRKNEKMTNENSTTDEAEA